jgi:hypothetical protein
LAEEYKKEWLASSGWNEVDHIWKERILVILEDFSTLDHFMYAYAVSFSGKPLTHPIGPDGIAFESKRTNNNNLFPKIVEDLQLVFDDNLPSHIVEESNSVLTYAGFVDNLILVTAFDREVNRGAANMKFIKRIRHLINLNESRKKGALYV